ncbi:MAG: hypothetical protein ACPHUF_14885 [Gammaproteobacteria bacterium]
MNNSPRATLHQKMFDRGLGELLIMRQKDDKLLLGNLVMDKNMLVFKDRGLLSGISPTHVAPCWDIGIIGAVCALEAADWDSLTFLGADHCKIPVDLSSTRHGLLRGIVNTDNESAIVFRGSVYRGFQLLLDENLLPVVMPLVIETDEGIPGLAVTDLRFASIPMETLFRVNDIVRSSVEYHLTLTVDDYEIDDQEFAELFSHYVEKD